MDSQNSSGKRSGSRSGNRSGEASAAQMPDVDTRFAATYVAAPHPAVLPIEQLLRQCELRTQPRSGPGGQHRNRTSSGAFLQHLPSGIVGEATERRSQAKNREVVSQRLRFRLAVLLRTPSALDRPRDSDRICELEQDTRRRYAGHPLRINDQNDDKPAVLALVLNDMLASGGQPSLVAKIWTVSTSRVVGFAKSHAAAFALVNQIRQHHGRGPLK